VQLARRFAEPRRHQHRPAIGGSNDGGANHQYDMSDF
jgi:hypothetical protein